MFGTYRAEQSQRHDYGILHDIHTYNVLHIVFDEMGNLIKDVRNAPDFRTKLNYIFCAPGWTHSGKDERVSTLQRSLEE